MGKGIPVKLQVFEGPLDLLLHLIDKNKIDIYDIPIVEITNQYMEYIQAMDRADLNVMSEFLVMAATLLDIKCKMLLPKEVNEEGEEEDPRQELVEQLLQYKMYKYMSYELRDRQVDGEKLFYKGATIPDEVKEYEEPVDLDTLLDGLTLTKLNDIFQDILKRQADKTDPIRSKFGKIEKEEVTLPEKLEYVYEYAKVHHRFSFRDLLKKQASKVQIIVTFLAVLELMKTGEIQVYQDVPTTEKLIHNMMDKYQKEERGIRIIELDHAYQLCSKPEMYEYLIRIAKQPKKYVLTDVMLETLSIIAYRQPITKLEIEKIRGVKSDHAVNKLIEYNLVCELGRLDAPGRPLLFGTTEEFLRRFSVQSLDDLPGIEPEKLETFKEEAEDEAQIRLNI